MIDIHCHLLPGLDDGPGTFEEALHLAESAIAQGITHLVATPHANEEYFFDYARARELRDALQARLGERLTLATGCDLHLNAENLAALRRDAAPFCLNQHDYLLVEFSSFSIPPSMDQTLHDLQLAGLHPIVTHPERNNILRTQPERLRNWVRHGCYAQVTAGVLIGAFGSTAQRDAEDWIAQGLIHFVASDSHDARRRPPLMKPACQAVEKLFGEEKARALFCENPRAAFEGQALPHVPEVAEHRSAPRRKRFFFF